MEEREQMQDTLYVSLTTLRLPIHAAVEGNVLNETITCLQKCFMQMCLVSMSQNLMSGLNMSKLAQLC